MQPLNQTHMIKISILYAGGEGKTFDMDYYRTKHMPMGLPLVGPACKKIEIEKGLSGGDPGSAPIYVAIGHLFLIRWKISPPPLHRTYLR
jgi:uncharacterized protein (TIGR02118 family)